MRRRSRPAADPEAVAALAVLDRYRAALRAQQAAGDPHAPWRLHILWWARHDITTYGMDFVSRLRVQGYAREVERLTRKTPPVLCPAQHWVNGAPAGEAG